MRQHFAYMAVQRQLLPSSDAVWVSDALLLATYERFFGVSRCSRRHGSFVPGPLESRRRIGKRKMAYMTGVLPPSSLGQGDLWGWFGQVDNTQWNWEPPTARRQEHAATTLGWLFGSDISPKHYEEPMDLSTIPAPESGINGEDVFAFQQSLQWAKLDEIEELCTQFNVRLKQNLTIGVISPDVLHDMLLVVPEGINTACIDPSWANSLKIDFIEATLDGLLSCKVIPFHSLNSSLLDRLLSLVSSLEITQNVRYLAHVIMTKASACQLEGMEPSVESLVRVWSSSWLNKDPLPDTRELFSLAVEAVDVSRRTLDDARKMILNLKRNSTTVVKPEDYRSSLNSIKSDISLGIKTGIKAVKRAEAALYPVRYSHEALRDCLVRVPKVSLTRIVESGTTHIKAVCMARMPHQTRIRTCWLTLVSQLPTLDVEIFAQTWQDLGDENSYLHPDMGSDILLSHIITRGYVRDPLLVRNTYETQSKMLTGKEYGHLIFALAHHDISWAGAIYIFKVLGQVNRHYEIYKALSILKTYPHRRTPTRVVRAALEITSSANARIAYSICKMHSPVPYSIGHLDPFKCPNFISSLIHDALIRPRAIWDVLGIPIYEEMSPRQLNRFSDNTLSPEQVVFFTRMASEFARSTARPKRVALRNVMQCLNHLRRHRVPLSPEMSSAVSYAGITREVVQDTWVGTERLRWALALVDYAEGKAASDIIDTAVWHYKQKKVQHQQERKRLYGGSTTS